jgi:hypothetical protein
MEPRNGRKYSKLLKPEEIEEVLMDEDSDEELEETDECMQSASSSEDEDNTEETDVMFRTRRTEDSPMSLISLDLLVASIVQQPPISMQNPLHFSLFMLFFRQIFQLILEEMNCYFHQYTISKNTAST